MKSTHLPSVSGGMLIVTGEAVIDPELRELQTFVPAFKTSNFVPNQEGKLSWYPLPGDESRIVIRVEKTGTNDGLLGTNPIAVSWFALGF